MKSNIKFLFALVLFSFASQAQSLEWAHGFTSNTSDANSYAVTTDLEGNIYVAGFFGGTLDFDPNEELQVLSTEKYNDIFFAKYSPEGNLIWAKNLPGTYIASARAIEVDLMGNIYIAGSFWETVDFDPGVDTYYLNSTSTSSKDSFLAKYNVDGELIWAHKFRGTKRNEIFDIALDKESNVYTIGTFQESIDFSSSSNGITLNTEVVDAFFTKFTSEGDLIWAKNLGGSANGFSITTDDTDNLYITGTFSGRIVNNSANTNLELISYVGSSFYVLKLDNHGTILWGKQSRGNNTEVGQSIAVNHEGAIFIGGYFEGTIDIDPSENFHELTTDAHSDAFILKLDANGIFEWVHQFHGTGFNELTSLVTDKEGDVYFSGSFNEEITLDGTYHQASGGKNTIFGKFNDSGRLQWSKQLTGGFSESNAVAVDDNSNLITTGFFIDSIYLIPNGNENPMVANGGHDFFIIKVDNSETTTNTYTAEAKTMMFYPNPSSGIFHISGDENTLVDICIRDLQGKIIKSYNQVSMNVERIFPIKYRGLYIVEVTTQDYKHQMKVLFH